MLFDSSDEETDEEVTLRAPEDAGSEDDSSDLHNEVETRLGSEVSEDTSSSTRSSDVDLKDIKKQNEQIISLLREIKDGESSKNNTSEMKGDPSELL